MKSALGGVVDYDLDVSAAAPNARPAWTFSTRSGDWEEVVVRNVILAEGEVQREAEMYHGRGDK
jgi:hypothetical protein